ncbi:hypothetical protein [Streptomyces sp. NPDC050600]|uniref:hypothetical protein n=1 Tax=Streptomyces sp. NPDC050600 TaxID=3157213 RepID=UPI00343A54C5
MNKEEFDVSEFASTDFTVEELDTLAAPSWNDVVQVTTAGGIAFVVGLSIT